MKAIPEIGPLDREDFATTVVAAGRPAVLRGQFKDWPLVAAGRNGPAELARYLAGFDSGKPAGCIVGRPEIRGRFFYRDDMTGFNFGRRDASVGKLVSQLLNQATEPAPLAIAMQSAMVDEVLPGLADANPMPLLDARVRPRIWIGNAIEVATHYDSNDNLACVVGGRRRFTLFPPGQISNLYIGPLEMTPAGTPVSMVSVETPDFDRYPRFAAALEDAETAELEPGDALYIPYFWWHSVRSLDPLSVLVNYWWNDVEADLSPVDAMLHAILALRDLPPERRAIWKGVFDHLVFHTDGDPVAHLPPEARGALGPIPPEQRGELIRFLAEAFARS
jgi:hypothetical protein